MIPSIANIRKAIYCLNKRIDLLEGGDYLDTMVELSNKISALESLLDDDALNPTAAIDKFNEIVAFLDSINNTETLLELLRDVILLSYQQNYVTVSTYANLPTTGSADAIYRVSNYNGSTNQIDTTSYSEYVWDNSDYTLLCVKSLMSEVFDISAYYATGGTLAKFADLTAALDSNNGGGVPQSFQKGGMSVKFVRSSDNKYVQYRLAAPNWSTDIHDWTSEDPYFIDKIMQEVNEAIDEHTPIEITGDVNNAPDEEDLTSVNVGGTDVLKFKDKAYNPLTYSGMGRKILRKNIVDGVNTLKREMMSDANTIYVIQYDFTLDEDITVPANCMLEFDGGNISGAYTITGQNTGVDAEPVKIFGINVTFSGTWNVKGVYPEWFGAKGNGITDDTNELRKSIELILLSKQCSIKSGGKTYLISNYLKIEGLQNKIVDFEDCTFTVTDFSNFDGVNVGELYLTNATLIIYNCTNCSFKNVIIKSVTDNERDCFGIIFSTNAYCNMQNVEIDGISKTQIYIVGGNNLLFDCLRFKNLGSRNNPADIYASGTSQMSFMNVMSTRKDDNNSSGQIFYISQLEDSNTYINNVRALNVHAPVFDVRSGNCFVENVYGENTGRFGIMSDTYSPTAKNAYIKNVILKNAHNYDNPNVCIYIQSFENVVLENINITTDLSGFSTGIQIINYYNNRTIKNIHIKNVNISGNIAVGLRLSNLIHPVCIEDTIIKNITNNHISVTDENHNNPIIKLKDVYFEGGYIRCVYDGTTTPYPYCCSEKSLIKRGTSIIRPDNLTPYDSYEYFDTTVNELLIWNINYWTNVNNERKTWPVQYELTNISVDNRKQANAGMEFSFTLIPNDGYTLPDTINIFENFVKMVVNRDYTYNSETGEVTITGMAGATGIQNALIVSAAGVQL